MRAPLTPLKAFLHDAERVGAASSGNADDGRLSQWLAVAQAAERIASLTPSDRSDYVVELTAKVLPPNFSRPTQIEGDGREPTDALGKLAERLRLEAEQMELAGCFELALVTVSAVCRMVANSELSQRLLATAQMGRIMRQMGDLDNATDCYSTVTNDAAETGDNAVAAHGYIGLGNVAYERGNRPLQKERFQQALKLAPHDSPVELSAHLGLMIVATSQRQLADALLHGWRAHDLSPPDSDLQLQTLSNLARTAFECGFLEAARSGFEFVIARGKSANMRIPAIGGAVRVAAALANINDVERMVALGRVEFDHGAAKYDVARFLLWCAEAWHNLNQTEKRDHFAAEAQKIALTFGFHEVSIQAERLAASPAKSFDKESSLQKSAVTADPQHDARNPAVRSGIDRLAALSV